MNDTTIFRIILLSEFLDMLKPIVAVLTALLLFYGALHVLRKRLEVKSDATVYEQVVPIACEYPDDHEFWEWYGTLIANVDITYEEARKWYGLRMHKDVAQMTGEPIAVEPEGESK